MSYNYVSAFDLHFFSFWIRHLNFLKLIETALNRYENSMYKVFFFSLFELNVNITKAHCKLIWY